MARQFSTFVTGTLHRVAAGAVGGAVLGIVAFVWFIAVSPALLSFAIAVGAAAAWCVWLEEHEDAPQGADRSEQTVWGAYRE
jgi:hypothetical protein